MADPAAAPPPTPSAPVAWTPARLSSAQVAERRSRGLTNAGREHTSRLVADILRANILTRFNLILGVLLAVIHAGGTGLLPGRRGRPARADRPAPRGRHHLPGRGERKTGRSATASPSRPSDPRSSPAGLAAQFRIWGYGVPTLRLSRRLPMPWRSSVSGTEHADLPRRDPGLGARRRPRDDRLPPASASAVRLYLLRR